MKSSCRSLLKLLNTANADDGFALLYGDEEVNRQKKRYLRLIEENQTLFSGKNVLFVTAPGRTELAGNHTDHNNGRVLAASVDLDCVALVTPETGMQVNLFSESLAGKLHVDLNSLAPLPEELESAAALVRGVAAASHIRELPFGGFTGVIHSTCPFGAGLSSSAAFSVLTGGVFSLLYGRQLTSPVTLAHLAQHAENKHFGKPCGLMDQLASSVGGTVFIDFATQEDPLIQRITANFESSGYQLAVVDTGGSHADLTPEYAAIPQEMRLAASAIGRTFGRGLTVEDLLENNRAIRDNAGDRAFLRLMHFILEDQRVCQQADALKSRDIPLFLELVEASGGSSMGLLQNCSSTTTAREQGVLLALALCKYFCPEAICRVHGGGFAGTIQAYIPAAVFSRFKMEMERVFGTESVIPIRTGRPGICALTAEGWIYPENRSLAI